jgi:N-acetyl-anhydromuramyl-L-alanine amidase AmpD
MEIVGNIKTNNYWKDRKDPVTKEYYQPKALVLHITDSSFYSTKSWFEYPYSYASSNYVVDENGGWWECVPEQHAAWANGKKVNPTWTGLINGVNPNLYTISVEVVNKGQMPSWKQWISWAKGCKEIMDRYPDIEVINHSEIHTGKTCPKPWFSKFWLNLLIKYV